MERRKWLKACMMARFVFQWLCNSSIPKLPLDGTNISFVSWLHVMVSHRAIASATRPALSQYLTSTLKSNHSSNVTIRTPTRKPSFIKPQDSNVVTLVSSTARPMQDFYLSSRIRQRASAPSFEIDIWEL